MLVELLVAAAKDTLQDVADGRERTLVDAGLLAAKDAREEALDRR
jgi:hypothetical protein